MHPKCTLGSGGGAQAVAGSATEPGARLDLMSSANAANEWELVVPDDDAGSSPSFAGTASNRASAFT